MMNSNWSLAEEMIITSNEKSVWDALVNPDKIKLYFHDTLTLGNWIRGNIVSFQGEWEGKKYEDKAYVTESKEGKVLEYDYFSSFFGIPDEPRNRSHVKYILSSLGENTLLRIEQTGFLSEDKRDHSVESWKQCLVVIKKICEGNG